MKLFLVRHGETTWNSIGRLQGKSNTHLSKLGAWQAKQIAKALKKEKISAIYSSPLNRSLDTAKEIAKLHKIKIKKRKELQEINYGMFEGFTFKQIEKKYAKVWQERRKHKFWFKPKGGESFKEMLKKRIKPFLKEIKKKHENQTVVVVAHSGSNRLIMGELIGLPNSEKVNVWQPNEVYYIVECKKKQCKVEYKQIGKKEPVFGYLHVKDIDLWNKGRHFT